MSEVLEEINAVRRQVAGRTSEAGETRVVTVSRTYDAPVEDVWEACISPERIARWFLPVSGDLKVGGRYQLEGNAGGTIERCEPPRGFTATWEFAGDVSRIELRLSDQSGSTLFELDHIANLNDHWARFGPGATGVGWEMGLRGLALYLSAEGLTDRAAAEAWPTTDEGRQYLVLSSRAWGEADIAGGADESEARAAAKRTEDAYTATPA